MTFEKINKTIIDQKDNLRVSAVLKENVETADMIKEIGNIYKIIRPILIAIQAMPIIPKEWISGLKTFTGLLDGITGIINQNNINNFESSKVHREKIRGKDQGWRSTGIEMKEGETAYITATGIISFGPFGSWPFSPEGEDNSVADGSAPAPGKVKNSLVAQAGSLPQYIGSSGQITAATDTVLQLANNDPWSGDNDGFWNVSIRIK
ncbi:hypothetical protein ACSIGC_09965 [Tenacibaculum sp. ZS6-P6]|uniref:hypothetical protein n=1 Tax=Tenacibaculum sp. ZS6-P6 TaxID=3447503 RepID=UPI003F981015